MMQERRQQLLIKTTMSSSSIVQGNDQIQPKVHLIITALTFGKSFMWLIFDNIPISQTNPNLNFPFKKKANIAMIVQ